jgi:serine/threonine protein kinase
MHMQTVTCSCGHRWQHAGPGPLPADVSSICPFCTVARQATLANPAESETPQGSAPLGRGQVIAGFELLEELNRGGMGVVYKARQLGLNRIVALKVITPDRLAHPDALKRFRREVQAAALLSHPNIVTVFHTDLDSPSPYLAMEYVAGIDLFRLVQKAGALPVEDACYYVRQAAHGLQHAFERGLVHRDIKPANLMVTPSPLDAVATNTARIPQVKILDMGLARVTAGERLDVGTGGLTQLGEFLGTPDFISPEQAEDSRAADIRSDLYSLGGTLFFLLTAEVPFPTANLMQKLRRQLTEPPPSPVRLRPGIPAEVDALVCKLLARDPANRFQTPAELGAALDEALKKPRDPTGTPKPADPTSSPARPVGEPPSTHSPVRQVSAHPGGVQALSLSADGRLLLSGGLDENLRLWDAGRLREALCVTGDVGPVEDVCMAPNGKWAASCSLRLFQQDMVVQLWELAGGTERRRLKGHTDTICGVAVSADGRRVAAGSADRTALVWAVDQPGSPSVCFKGHTAPVSCVGFLSGGDSLLTGSHDGTVRLWDARTGEAKGRLKAHFGKVEAVAFGGPSKRIAVAGEGLHVRQVNGSFTTLRGHRGSVLCVVFWPEGQLVLSGGADGTVRLWRAEDGEELTRFKGHDGPVRAVAVSPDGRTAFSGGADGTIRRWTLLG